MGKISASTLGTCFSVTAELSTSSPSPCALMDWIMSAQCKDCRARNHRIEFHHNQHIQLSALKNSIHSRKYYYKLSIRFFIVKHETLRYHHSSLTSLHQRKGINSQKI